MNLIAINIRFVIVDNMMSNFIEILNFIILIQPKYRFFYKVIYLSINVNFD